MHKINSHKNRNSKPAFILLEFVIGLSIVSVLLTLFMTFVFTEIKDNQKYSLQIEKNQQIVFAQNYLQHLADNATSISIVGQIMIINSETKNYTIGLRKNALYVKQKAYRYLTTSPFKVDSLTIEEINMKLFKLKLSSTNKIYEILIKKQE